MPFNNGLAIGPTQRPRGFRYVVLALSFTPHLLPSSKRGALPTRLNYERNSARIPLLLVASSIGKSVRIRDWRICLFLSKGVHI